MHLDICRPSYGQRKGRGSNWQFDSRPLKVGNRPLPEVRIESSIRRWKDLDEGYKFGSDLVAIRLRSQELRAPKVPGLHPGRFRDNFGTPFRESWEFVPFGCSPHGASQGEPLAGRGATAPSVIREIEEVHGREQVPRDGGLALSKDVTMKPLGPKGPLNIKLLILTPILSRGPNGLPGGHANLGSGFPGLEEDSLQGVLTVEVLTAPFGP